MLTQWRSLRKISNISLSFQQYNTKKDLTHAYAVTKCFTEKNKVLQDNCKWIKTIKQSMRFNTIHPWEDQWELLAAVLSNTPQANGY